MKINDICSRFSSGKSISPEKIFETGKYPVYGGNGIRGYSDNYNFNGECAVIGRQGAYCGNVKFFSGKGYMTEHAVIAIGNKNTNTRFLAYKFGMMNFGKYASQSAQPGLSVEMLGNLEIDLPPRETQDRIAALLGALDDKIALNKKINATLEAMAKTLYDYWFVQFDFPDENGKPYKMSGGKMIYSSELGRDIPAGWEVGNILNLANIFAGGDRPKIVSEYKTNFCNVPIYSNGADDNSLYGFTNHATVNNDSITISARGNIGYTALRKGRFVPIIRLIVITPHDNTHLEYVYQFLKNYSHHKNGSVQQQLTVPQVETIRVVIPPKVFVKNIMNL